MNTHLSVGTHASRFVCGLAVGMHLLFGAGEAHAQTNLRTWGDQTPASNPPPTLPRLSQFSFGLNHAVGIGLDGRVFAWGENLRQQTDIPVSAQFAVEVQAGQYYSGALLSNGSIVCWGDNEWTQSQAPSLNAVAFRLGFNHGLAIRQDGTVAAWGRSTYGATTVPPTLGVVDAVAAGDNTSYAIQRSTGEVKPWGYSFAGSLAVPSMPRATKIAAGPYHGLALCVDGQLRTWGINSPNTPSTVPGTIVDIAASQNRNMVLRNDGTVLIFGSAPTSAPPKVSQIVAAYSNAGGLISDCDANGILDSDEIDASPWLDCNNNGLLDVCADSGVPSGPFKWVAVTGGSFQDFNSWCFATQTTAPTTGSSISFPYSPSYNVFFTQNRTVRNMEVGAGFPTLNLAGKTLTLSSSTQLAQAYLRIGTVAGTPASLGVISGTVSAVFTEVGHASGVTDSFLGVGPGGVSVSTQEICVGCSGVGTMNVVSGGRVVSQKGVIGKTEAGRGEVLVQGVPANPQNNTPPIQSSWDSTLGVDIRNGTLTVGPEGVINSPAVGVVLYSGGVLQGTGRINGTVTNFGAAAGGCGNSGLNGEPALPRRGGLVPGGSAGDTQSAQGVPTIGTLTINGFYQQIEANPLLGTNSGSLLIEVMPGATGPEYDRLVVNGTASFGGGLFVEFPGGDPGSFDALPIITASSVDPDRNMFDVAVMPGLPDGRFVKVDPVQGLKGGGGGISISTSTLSELLGFGAASSSGLSLEPLAAAVADFDGQNGPDVAVTTKGVTATSPGNLFILFNDGQGGLQQAVQWPGLLGIDPVDIVAAPLRANTNLTDLAVVNKGSDTLQVLYNEGNGTFTSQGVINLGTGTGPVAVAAASIYSEQGLAGAAKDLIVANGGSNSILVFKVFGPFPWGLPLPLPTPIRPSDVDGVDIDNNRTCDILVTARGASTVTAYTFDRKQQVFSDGIDFLTGEDPVSMALADLDGDGRTDVTTVNAESNSVSVLVNRTLPGGQVNFAPAVSLPTGPDPVSVATGDFDLDTPPGDPPDLDIAFTARASSSSASRVVKILRNDRQDGVLVLAPAEDQIVPGSPKIVLAAEMDPVEGADLVTVGQNSAATANFNSFLGNASVRPAVRSKKPCTPGDVNCDGAVDGNDLGALLAAYGTAEPSADFNRDGVVAGEDLAILLAAWGSGTS